MAAAERHSLPLASGDSVSLCFIRDIRAKTSFTTVWRLLRWCSRMKRFSQEPENLRFQNPHGVEAEDLHKLDPSFSIITKI